MNNMLSMMIPVLLAIMAGLGWLYRHERERRLQVEQQLSDKKYQVYAKLISVYFDIFKGIKKATPIKAENYLDKMIDIKKELTIYGNDKVLRSFFDWEIDSNNSGKSLRPFTKIIIEIRRDMGNNKTQITVDDFLRSLFRSNEEYEELRKKGIV